MKGNEYSGAGGELILAGGGVSSSLIDFYTNSGQRARITSTGELNIGGSYTQTTNKLNVTGTAYVSSDITSGDDIIAADEIRNNVPGDFWASDNTFINFNSVGNITHQGGYEVNITSNGYRDTNGQWISLAANSNTGAAQIGLTPQGNIIFRTDASKSNGTSHNPTERLRIDSSGRLSFAGDTDTYIHHPEDNELAITVSGGSQPIARFGTGGNNATVGINTTVNLVTNSEILSVRGYSSFKSANHLYAALYTHNESQGGGNICAHILLNVSGANRGGFGYGTDNSTLIMGNQNAISFRTGSTNLNGTERLLIKNTGGVGINTSLIRNNRFLNIAAPSQDYSNSSTELMDGGGICLQHTDSLASTNRTYPGIFWSGNTASLGRARAGILGVTASNNDATDIVFLTRYAANGTGFYPSDERLRIESGGNVRVSDEHLRFDTTGKGIIFGIDGGSNRPSIIGNYTSSSDNNMVFNVTGNERLRIKSTGVIEARTLAGSYYPIASARDGSTSARAATSAWEIKKTLGPRAKTGYYYLINPYDSSVNTWWCDMTTDGGGWILVAHVGDGQMSSQSTSAGNHWFSRSHKGGFDTVGSGYYKGGGYWRTSGGAWAENTCGQLMWDVRTQDSQYDNYSNAKVVFNWGTDQAIPDGGSGYSNIPNAGNRRFNEWCYEVVGAPGFNPSNYHQNERSNTINGGNHFTEHMVMTFCFRGTGGGADDGDSGPYWMIGSHHDGLHQHYEEGLSGNPQGVYGSGGYYVVSNEDTGWGGGGSNGGYPRIGRHTNTGVCNVWLR